MFGHYIDFCLIIYMFHFLLELISKETVCIYSTFITDSYPDNSSMQSI